MEGSQGGSVSSKQSRGEEIGNAEETESVVRNDKQRRKRGGGREMKTSELDIVVAIEGAFQLMIHMLQQEQKKKRDGASTNAPIVAVAQSAAGAVKDLRRLCVRRKALTRKMALVVADQRQRIQLLEQKETDSMEYRDKVEKLRSDIFGLSEKNSKLHEKVLLLEDAPARKEPVRGPLMYVACTQTEDSLLCRPMGTKDDAFAVASSDLVVRRKTLAAAEKVIKLEKENDALRNDITLLIEEADRRDHEIRAQSKITEHLNTIIRSQKKMIRALRGQSDDDVVVEETARRGLRVCSEYNERIPPRIDRNKPVAFSGRPPLSPAPGNLSDRRRWDRRDDAHHHHQEEEEEEEEEEGEETRFTTRDQYLVGDRFPDFKTFRSNLSSMRARDASEVEEVDGDTEGGAEEEEEDGENMRRLEEDAIVDNGSFPYEYDRTEGGASATEEGVRDGGASGGWSSS